jgi:uncharacterized C2H2 Zn-finger protein
MNLIIKSFLLVVVSAISITNFCMEPSTINNANQAHTQPLSGQQYMMLALNAIPTDPDISNLEKVKLVQKLETIKWVREIIHPLNDGRFHPLHKGAQANCTLIAEKCVRVLAGLATPSLVAVKREDLDITFKQSEDGTIIYHEVIRPEQAELRPPQLFIEIIEQLEGVPKAHVDLTQTTAINSLKYITSTLLTLSRDIQSLPGSAATAGEDKTLCGLIYYYYKDIDAGHLANFYRDRHGNLFFVDAQSESITDVPPTKILDYELKDEVFFCALAPNGGYFIKRELGLWQARPDQMDEDTYAAGVAKAALVESVTKSRFKDEGILEPTDSMLLNADDELIDSISNSTTYQERSSAEEDTFSENSDNSSQSQVTGHKRKREQKKPYTCDLCDYSTGYSIDFKRHERTHTGEKPYKCDQCDKAFNDSGNLNMHKRTHTGEKPYKCDQCDKAFAHSGNLTAHKRIHTGEKPYKCDQCDKAFNDLSNLKVHKRIHTGEKPYSCDQCEKAFTSSGDFKRHKRIHMGEKPYKCDQCEKAFARSGDLNMHKRTHTGERPYTCDQCEKAFAQSSGLIKHKRTHTGEKSYQCDFCEKAFTSSGDFKRHKRTHTGEKPYICEICSRAFAQSSALTGHKKKKHENPR